jgi:hypothetical protein
MNQNFTTDEGPSAHNQSSNEHSHDSNQAARQPSTRKILEAEGLMNETLEPDLDIGNANLD